MKVLIVIYGLMSLGVYLLYLKGVKLKGTTPSPVTWFIWSGAGILNTITSYQIFGSGSLKYLIALIACVCAVIVFLYSLLKGSFKKFNLVDIVISFLVIVLMFYWFRTNDERTTNLLLQVVYLLSFVPIIYNIGWKNAFEYKKPFELAIFTYTVAIIIVLIGWNGDLLELAYPVLNGIVGNGSVIFILRLRRYKLKSGYYEGSTN